MKKDEYKTKERERDMKYREGGLRNCQQACNHKQEASRPWRRAIVRAAMALAWSSKGVACVRAQGGRGAAVETTGSPENADGSRPWWLRRRRDLGQREEYERGCARWIAPPACHGESGSACHGGRWGVLRFMAVGGHRGIGG